MKVDEMPAGRELDILVAERVMGWKQVSDLTDEEVAAYIKEGWQSDREPTREDIHYQRTRWIVGGECDCADWMRPDGLPVSELPPYSTDIRAAWEVFQALPRKLKHGTYCSRSHKYDPNQMVGVTWYLIDTHHFSGYYPESKRRFFCKAELDCGEIKWFSEGESLPHAICRAALKAMSITEI